MAKKTPTQDLQEEYLRIVRKLDGDPAGRAAGIEYLVDTYRGDSVDLSRWATNPVVFNAQEYETLSSAAITMGSIMEKVMAKYHRDRSFRRLFGLSSEVERLTLVPSGCNAAVPLARVDLFFDRKTRGFKICGIATGGLSGMASAAEMDRAVSLTNAYHEFSQAHPSITSYNPVDACIRQLLYTYKTWANAGVGRNHPTKPALAILDVPNSERAIETQTFINHLHGQGIYAHATTFDQLRVERVGSLEQLVDDHGPVSCIWLRATVDECVASMGEGVRALERATSHGLVCTIGGYRSWPCCTRRFLEVLRNKDCQVLLTTAERSFIEQHIPVTHVVNPASDISEYYDQEHWAIKVSDGREIQGVIAGAGLSQAQWRMRLVQAIKRRDAVQEYIPQQPMTVWRDGEQEMNVILGMYVFGGKLCGVRASCGTGNTIADWDDRLEMGFFSVDE